MVNNLNSTFQASSDFAALSPFCEKTMKVSSKRLKAFWGMDRSNSNKKTKSTSSIQKDLEEEELDMIIDELIDDISLEDIEEVL